MQAGRDQRRGSTRRLRAHATTNFSWLFASRILVHYTIFALLFLAVSASLTNGFCDSLVGGAFQASWANRILVDPGMLPPSARRVEMTAVSDRGPIAYFLEQPPDDAQMSMLPKAARDVVVARVHVLGVPAYLGGRDQSGRPSSDPPPKHALFARLRVIDVRLGDPTVGGILGVKFGTRDSTRTLVHHPHTPDQLGRDYFVAMFRDDDGQLSLAGFPITEAQYREWETEFWDFERTRGKPGAPR
jgi:hypothetical protein